MSDIPVILPDVMENFSALWNVDCQGKDVLDIGADHGSTASYFLRQGANFVICVEGDPDKFNQLVANLPLLKRARAIYKWISNPEDMTEILWINSADIVKIDIEGAEKHLLGVSPYIIQHTPEYMIEVHIGVDIGAIISLFQQCGYDVTYGARSWLGNWQIIHCKKYQ